MIYVLSTDDDTPTGGIKILYRHVDVLSELGYEAAVVHREPGFRCTWFDNETRIVYSREISPTILDHFVIPEVYGPRMVDLIPGTPKVIFNQNGYLTFNEYPLDGSCATTPYRHREVIGGLVVSDDVKAYLAHAFPDFPTHLVRSAIDPELFARAPGKKRRIAFMPRKHPEEIGQVMNILAFRGALEGFEVCPIEGATEADVAQALGEAMVFFSFGYHEGFGLPPAEAMARGCIVVGYHGNGGREYFKEEFCYPIEPGDVIGFARTAEGVLAACRAEDPEVLAKGRAASESILGRYTPAQERADVAQAWEALGARRS